VSGDGRDGLTGRSDAEVSQSAGRDAESTRDDAATTSVEPATSRRALHRSTSDRSHARVTSPLPGGPSGRHEVDGRSSEVGGTWREMSPAAADDDDDSSTTLPHRRAFTPLFHSLPDRRP